MNKRKLGNSGIEISPLVFGGNVLGWTVDEPTGFQLLDSFVAAGFNAIDTADVYSKWAPGHTGGESETLIGKWLKRSGKRSSVVIATKVGIEMGAGKKGLSRARIMNAVEESLNRLQTDYIDLYQSHTDDAETPLEETLGAYAEGYEAELEPLCEREKVSVINYFPLASGFLTGKYRSEEDLTKGARGQFVKKYLNERGFKIVAALDQVAKQHNATLAQVALAWCLARPSITAPIASATNLDQLNDLMGAVKLQLDGASIDLLNQASAPAATPASAS